LSNLVEDDVTQTLIKTVKDNYPNLSHRYYALKAKWFGKKSLPYWDRNAPLPKQSTEHISWDEAKEIVLSAYGEFSSDLAVIAEEFFDKGWIDAKLAPGKDSGAFSHPTVPSCHPYILLNYHGKIRDVMTLAHELGHGIHQVLSARQGALMADTPLTLAETASVFGEQLTFRKLLNREQDPERRKLLIAGKVEDMLNTVVRQIAFCEFEFQVHTRRRDKELSAEEIGKIWMNVQQDALGPAIELSNEYQHYWSYIPHFIHTPFYVYAYAFGDCLVNTLYQRYLEEPQGFEKKYIELLSAGGSLRHKELLAPFNLDASEPEFWQHGLTMISNFIDELEAE
jgi:oligoendopeptidase F